MKLSHHFALAELTKSQTAERNGIDNTPPKEALDNLTRLAWEILEPVRENYVKPFSPSSGYRCLELNRAIGSKDSSQHVKGEAVDFEVPGVSNYDLACWVRDNLEFDQCILEFYTPGNPESGWVHVSKKERGNRMNCLTINQDGVRPGFIP